MAIRNADELSAAVLSAMAATPDARLREIMQSLVRHLHGFVREVGLTEAEFRSATALLNRMGQLSNDRHNEFVLMAGSLGVSALVCLLNHTDAEHASTSQNLLGPFWRMHSPRTANGASLLRSPTPGDALFATLHLVDRDGRPLEGAEVDIWHCNAEGLYENQDEQQADHNLRGKFVSDADGRIAFRSIKPAGYPIPTDTVVGELLKAQQRHPYRPAHLHALVFKPGYKTLITQIYADDDPRLATDVQFGVTEAVIGRFERHDTPRSDEPGVAAPWYSLEHRLVMSRGEAVLPRAPIK
jgi:catechol 1,2-dioxygenase